MVHSIKDFLKINEPSTGKKFFCFLSILVRIDSTISSMTCSDECARQNRIGMKIVSYVFVNETFRSVVHNFSKILLKFDNNEISL